MTTDRRSDWAVPLIAGHVAIALALAYVAWILSS